MRKPAPRSFSLLRAVAFYASYGIQVERVLTNNGSPYISTAHATACHALPPTDQ